MRKKQFLRVWIVTVVLLVLLSLSVTAASSVTVTPVKNLITPSDSAVFELFLQNNEQVAQRYSLYSFAQGWNVDPSPLKDKIIELAPGENYTTKIIVQPLDKGLPPGIYYNSITVESDTGEKYQRELKVYLKYDEQIDYLPAIKVTVDMTDKINPREPVSIKLFLENRNPLNLSDLVIKIQSDIPEFVQERQVELPPLEKKTVEFSVIPNKYQQPKVYVLFFVFEHKGQVAKVIEQKIEVLPLIPDFPQIVTETSAFLQKEVAVQVSNPGNVRNAQGVVVPLSFWEALFTKSDGVKEYEDAAATLQWRVELGPEDTTVLRYTVDYKILLYLVLLLLAFGLFYWYASSPVVVTKSAITSKGAEEGALSEIKITLEVQNKSKTPLHHVTISDVVPAIANVTKSLELGTLRPKSVAQTKAGTKVVWALAELDGHEHRLITYKVKATLNILGTFSLPRAVVEYKMKSGRKRKAYSNLFRLGKEAK